ncbi:hypothetical protein EVAR_12219_1 [Eumeta japonica]|uniref:Uncharacterized protein n=1 Tax=Eumeta variegata TaxID=151549 RepID=A0A4C1UHF1_EUMVA|nr:hypothetical protein EVAR_12219_1 [Eumeta japonica]
MRKCVISQSTYTDRGARTLVELGLGGVAGASESRHQYGDSVRDQRSNLSWRASIPNLVIAWNCRQQFQTDIAIDQLVLD